MLRNDGRKHDQIRNISFTLGVDLTVDGSCLYKQGLTEVICLVQGPRAKTQQQDVIIIEYSVSPFSNTESKRSNRFDKEFSMFAENLRESYENLIFLDRNGKSEILITVCVIQNDGGQKAAIFNAVTLALLDAGVQMKDFLVAVSVGLENGLNLVDLNQDESKNAQGELTISYQQRKKKLDFFELKTLKLNQTEVLTLTQLATQKAEEVYKSLRADILEIKNKELDKI